MNQNIWQEFQKGNKDAFRELYQQYIDVLYGYGMKITGDSNIVNDNIQALFIYLWEKKGNLSYPTNLTGYLLASLRNRLLKDLKKQQKLNANSLNIDDIHEIYNFDFDIDIQETLARKELNEEKLYALKQAIDTLTPRQKEVIYLRFYKGLSPDEVAEIMDISNQIVRNHTYDAIKKLRENKLLSKTFIITILMLLREMSQYGN